MRFLITMVISFTVALKCNEWMTVFTLCDSDLREAGARLGSARLIGAPAASEVKEAHKRQTYKPREAAIHLTHFQLNTVAFRTCFILFFNPQALRHMQSM